jgi:hypothetical protein
MYKQAMRMQEPWRQAGMGALAAEAPVSFEPTEADIMRLEQGTEAMRAQQAATGRRRAGGSAEQLGQLAGGIYEDVYNRAYGDLMSRSNLGARFGQQLAQQAMGTGQDIGSAYTQGAGQQAQYIGQQGQMGAQNLAMLGRLGGDIYNYMTTPSPQDFYGPGF